MKKILNLSNYPAVQIADSINSIWVGEYGLLDRNNFACGITDLLNYMLGDENSESHLISSIVIEIYCGNRQKAENVRKIMQEKGFMLLEAEKSSIKQSVDNYIVFIGKLSFVDDF